MLGSWLPPKFRQYHLIKKQVRLQEHFDFLTGQKRKKSFSGLLFLDGFFRERVFGLLANLGKAFGILNGNVRKHLAVDFDIREGETVDQFGIGKTIQTGRGVNPGDPQFAEISFFPTTVAVRVSKRVHDLFFCGPV